MQKKYKTNRLDLSQLTDQDLPELNQLLNDDQLMQASGLQLPNDKEQRLLALSLLVGDQFIYLIRLIQTNELIGVIGFYQCYRLDFSVSTKYRELGYLLSKDYWSNGYMPEAGNRLINEIIDSTNYEYICAGVMPDNLRSARVLIKLGLQQTIRPLDLAAEQFEDGELYFQLPTE
ncbi:GNAT family N-acetyltransferase [Paucilactobacillus kaifaensis]|uniref:GNAT family N-acetyltransferase n=1 Tax=Paucilactobacillus kaifaensis TaxID=2559921 RepID=UPI0010F4C6C9|nr:GNAT family N-acetyltransferase [Paucilactobacillus kaifaensis]